MKKVIALAFAFFFPWLLAGQEDGKKIIIEDATIAPVQAHDSILRLNLMPDAGTFSGFINYYTAPDIRLHPLGFTNVYGGYLTPDFYYTITGSSDVWPGITTINKAHFDIHHTSGPFSFTAGSYMMKYDNNFRPYTDVVFHADTSYDVLPWLTLGAYAQYSALSKQNARDGSIMPAGMIPYSSYGVYGTMMFTPMFGIGGGVGRQFNPYKNEWENTYGFGPVIELKKKKKK